MIQLFLLRSPLLLLGWLLLAPAWTQPVLGFEATPDRQDRQHWLPQAQTEVSLLERGQQLYEMGRFSEAAELWQQATQTAERQGDRLGQAQGLNYLALAYQDIGNWPAAQATLTQSLQLLQSQPNLSSQGATLLAQAWNNQGSLHLAQGQPETALANWEQAEAIYTQAKDPAGAMGSRLNQAQALQALGLYRRARTLLEDLNTQLQDQPDSALKALNLQSLGIVQQVVGDQKQAQVTLEQSLKVSQSLTPPLNPSVTFLNLGNATRTLPDPTVALQYYEQAAAIAPSPLLQVEAQLNQFSLLVATQHSQAAQALLPQIQQQLASLSPSRRAIYAQVNLAATLLKAPDAFTWTEPQAIAPILARAIQQAEALQDPRAKAYAIGWLGRLYEQTQQWSEAEALTRQALLIAQTSNAEDIAYRWQWQLGRILKQQGQRVGAIAAYTEAVESLQSIRADLLATNTELQFSFRESVEPVYRELVSLLIRPDSAPAELQRAREVIEGLQLAELENFFRSACIETKAEFQQIDQLDSAAAVVYPILLPDRLEVILSIPGQPLTHHTVRLAQETIENQMDLMLQSLNPAYSNQERLRYSRQLYDWLIRPAEAQLAGHPTKTLVFVLDGFLRNLPMSALYDGQHYLIEKYDVALAPGLKLLEPKLSRHEPLRALTAGLTEARQGFTALPAVANEVTQITEAIPSAVVLNQDFTKARLKSLTGEEAFPIIHLATHGQFSSDSEGTFLLAWDQKIRVEELRSLLERQTTNAPNTLIDLLVLSACQTAAGDKRAALGLAGIAVQAGARSTLATLWSVNDDSTALLMSKFYHNLTQTRGISKAEALRQAQRDLLANPEYNHPYFWAPFVLVGNWL